MGTFRRISTGNKWNPEEERLEQVTPTRATISTPTLNEYNTSERWAAQQAKQQEWAAAYQANTTGKPGLLEQATGTGYRARNNTPAGGLRTSAPQQPLTPTHGATQSSRNRRQNISGTPEARVRDTNVVGMQEQITTAQSEAGRLWKRMVDLPEGSRERRAAEAAFAAKNAEVERLLGGYNQAAAGREKAKQSASESRRQSSDDGVPFLARLFDAPFQAADAVDRAWKNSTVGKTVDAGASQVISGVASTLAIPDKIAASAGADPTKLPLLQFDRQAKEAAGYFARQRDEAVAGKGKAAQIMAELGSGAVSALPNAILAIMTSGGSAVSQLAPQAKGIADTVAAGVSAMMKNPMYWTSFLQSAGSEYDEAVAAGADSGTAALTALTAGLINSAVEIGGGVETLPQELRKGGGHALREWLKSGLDEGKEEIIQGIVSGVTQKAMANTQNPWFSTTDENAAINPAKLAKEGAMGAGVGLLLGGGQVAANAAINKAISAPQTSTTESGKVLSPQDYFEMSQGKDAEVQKNSAPAVVVADTTLFDRGVLRNFNHARKKFMEYARKYFPASVKNLETGKEIGISRNGLDKFLSGNILYEKFASGFHIPELIEKAHKVAGANNTHVEQAESIPTYEYYDSPIEIDGEQYNAHIRVRNTNMGDKYYGHTISEVDDIKIEPPTRVPSSDNPTGQPVNTGGSEDLVPADSTDTGTYLPQGQPQQGLSDLTLPQQPAPVNPNDAANPSIQDYFDISQGKTVEAQKNSALEGASNSGIVPFTKSEGDNLSSAKGYVVGREMSFRNFIEKAKSLGTKVRFYFGKVSDTLGSRIASEIGKDVSGYNIAMRTDEVLHTFKDHGNPQKEALRGHVAITPDLLERLPEVFNNPDEIIKSPKKDYGNRDAFELRKWIDGYRVAMVGISDGRHSIEVDTVWVIDKKRPTTAADATQSAPPSPTPKTSSGQASFSDAPLGGEQRGTGPDQLGTSSGASEEGTATVHPLINNLPQQPAPVNPNDSANPSIGAADAGFTQEQGPQVPTQNKTVTDGAGLNREQRAEFAPGTHERISEQESMNRAKDYFYRDSKGEIVNLKDTVENLLEKQMWTGVEQDVAQEAFRRLLQEPKETRDSALIQRLGKAIEEIGGTEAGRSLQARKKWVDSGAGIVSEATKIVSDIEADYSKADSKRIRQTSDDLQRVLIDTAIDASRIAVDQATSTQETLYQLLAELANNQTENEGQPVEYWLRDTARSLAQRVNNNATPQQQQQTTTTMQQMLRDVVRLVQGAAPEQQKQQVRTTPNTDAYRNYLMNQDAYEGVVNRAQRYLAERYANNPEMLAVMNDWLSGNGINSSNLARRAILENAGPISDVLSRSWQDKAEMLQQVQEAILQGTDLSAEEAEAAARQISDTFYTELYNRSRNRLSQMFQDGGNNGRTQTTFFERLQSMINLGAFDESDFRELAESKLFGHTFQDGIIDRIVDLSNRYDEAVADRSMDGLAQIVRDVSQTRRTGTLLHNEFSRQMEWSLRRVMGSADMEYMQKLASSSILAIAEDATPRTRGEQITTLRRQAMLSKFSTVMRNLVSNNVFDPVDSLARNISVPLDMFLSHFTGTRSVAADSSWLSPEKRRGSLDGFARAYLETALDVDTEGGTRRTETGRRTFRMSDGGVARILSTWEKYTGYLLNATDEFQKGGIRESVQSGIDRLYEQGKISDDSLREAGDTEALYRTFQDENRISNAVLGARQGLNNVQIGGMGLGDFIVPFAQVPSNLAARVVDYSPVGVVKGLYDLANVVSDARSGNLTAASQARAVQEIGRGVLGSVLMAGMTALSLKGVIGLLDNGGTDDDKNQEWLQKSFGQYGTQWNLSAMKRLLNGESGEWQNGDDLMNIDFLDPFNALMTTASLIAEDIKESEEDIGVGTVFEDTLAGTVQAVMDLPMMDTLQTFSQNLKNAKERNEGLNAIEAGKQLLASGVSGFVPNAMRGIATGLDPVQRDAYTSDNLYDQITDSFKASIPGLRETLPAKLDNFGNEMRYNAGPVQHFLNQNILPGSFTTYGGDNLALAKQLDELYKETGNAAVYPNRKAPNTIDQSKLTQEEKDAYQKTSGQTFQQVADKIISTEAFRQMDGTHKAELLQSVKELSNAIAKDEWATSRGIYLEPQKDLQLVKSGVPADVLLSFKAVFDDIDKTGTTDVSDKDVGKIVQAFGDALEKAGVDSGDAGNRWGAASKVYGTDVLLTDYLNAKKEGNKIKSSNEVSQSEAGRVLSGMDKPDEYKAEMWGMFDSGWEDEKNPFSGELHQAGVPTETVLDIMDTYSEIYKKEESESEKGTEFLKYLDQLTLKKKQRAAVESLYKFRYMIPSAPKAYNYQTMTSKQKEAWDNGGKSAFRKEEKFTSKYYEIEPKVKDIESLKDKDGKTIDNSKGLQIMQKIYQITGLTDSQRLAMFEAFGVGKTVRGYSKEEVEQALREMRYAAGGPA